MMTWITLGFFLARVKELKRGMKCCTPIANRCRATGTASPKRIQNSPYAPVGGKSSPKKVKLGLQHSLIPTPGMKMKTSLPFHPAHLPFSSTPKGQGRKAAPWLGRTSPVKGIPKTDSSAKKLTEKGHPAPVARGESSQEDRQLVKCLKVEPVQKQLVSRDGFPHHSSDQLEEDGRFLVQRCTAAWTSVSPRQSDRELHLRLYHQQFQQPPLLQQKLHYQPLEKFLAQYKPQEMQLTHEASGPAPASPPGRDETMQLEELDDSDFSEDSFSPGPSRRKAEADVTRKGSPNSFFLHQRDWGAQEPDVQDKQELLCKWYEFDKKGATTVSSEEESSNYEEGSRSLSGWSSEEISAPLNSGTPEKPYCSEEGGLLCNKVNSKELLAEQKQPKCSDPSRHCPDEPFSVPRKFVTQSPPLAALLLEPAFPGMTEKKDLPQRAGFCGALDFPMDLAGESMAPLSASFLHSGPVDTQGSGEKILSPRKCWDEDTGPFQEKKESSTSSMHEINHWRREAGRVRSPEAKYTWRSQPSPSPHDSSLLGATSASGELRSCVCGYLSEDPLADVLPRHTEESTSLQSSVQASEYSTTLQYGSEPEVTKIAISCSCSGQLALGKEEDPAPSAPCSPVDKGEASSIPAALPGSDNAGKLSDGSALSRSDLSHEAVELYHSEEAFGKVQNHEVTEQDSGAESRGTTAGTAKSSLKACGPVDFTEGSLKHKEALGRQLVLQNHQEQLDEMATLCSWEESLITKMPDLEFEDCAMKLDEILRLKAECIRRARTQLQLFLAAPSSNTALLPMSST